MEPRPRVRHVLLRRGVGLGSLPERAHDGGGRTPGTRGHHTRVGAGGGHDAGRASPHRSHGRPLRAGARPGAAKGARREVGRRDR